MPAKPPGSIIAACSPPAGRALLLSWCDSPRSGRDTATSAFSSRFFSRYAFATACSRSAELRPAAFTFPTYGRLMLPCASTRAVFTVSTPAPTRSMTETMTSSSSVTTPLLRRRATLYVSMRSPSCAATSWISRSTDATSGCCAPREPVSSAHRRFNDSNLSSHSATNGSPVASAACICSGVSSPTFVGCVAGCFAASTGFDAGAGCWAASVSATTPSASTSDAATTVQARLRRANPAIMVILRFICCLPSRMPTPPAGTTGRAFAADAPRAKVSRSLTMVWP